LKQRPDVPAAPRAVGLADILDAPTLPTALQASAKPGNTGEGHCCKASFLYLALVFLIKVLRRFATYRLRACLIATERTVAPIEEA